MFTRKDESNNGIKSPYKKKVTFQIDFRQKSFFLCSSYTPWYHAFISIRSVTLRIPPSSFLLIQRSSFYTLDRLWLLRGSDLLPDLSRYLKERDKSYGTEASNSRLLSRSTERTIRLLCPRSSFFSWLHFCPLLDILFYWSLGAFVPSFLSPWRSHLHPFALPSTIHASRLYVPPFLWESIYPIFFNLSPRPSATGIIRDAYPSFLTTCLSSATSFYSAFRISNVIIHPSAKLLRES